MKKVILGCLIIGGLAACGAGGPSDGELKRACIDSNAFRGDDDRDSICQCMTKQIKAEGIDKQYMLEHWQAQKAKGYTGSFLPSSVDSSIARRCGRQIR